jgi:DNA polymerase III delta prime subunit
MAIITVWDMAKRVREEAESLPNKFLLYGPPGSGKTLVAATISKMSGFGRIIWADLEDGLATIATAKTAENEYYFKPEELAKLEHLPIPDKTMLDPGTAALLGLNTAEFRASTAQGAKIMLPLLVSPTPLHYDAVERKLVQTRNENCSTWCLGKLKKEDVLIIDSGTQLASSIFSLAIASNPDHNHGQKHWYEFTTNANAMLSAIQAAKCTVIMICHSLNIEASDDPPRKARTLPWFGSANYSAKVGHHFGTVVHMYCDSQYRSLSTPLTRLSIQGKSRFNVDTAKISNPTMEDLLGLSERAHKASTYIVDKTQPATKQNTQGTQAQPAAKPGLIKR